MKRSRGRDIAVIGGGKVGNAVGRLFREGGDRIVAVISRTASSARRTGRFLDCRNTSTSLSAIPPKIDLLFIATPHAGVSRVAAALARLPGRTWKGVAVCHASGMLTAAVLAPLRRKGATVFSFHPLQTFPRDLPVRDLVLSARGIFYGVDGSPPALRVAALTARRIGGTMIRIRPERRVLYHAACVVASNQLTGLMFMLERLARGCGIGEKEFFKVFTPIIAATLRNIAASSPASALSGPVARGGIETVSSHCAAVRRQAPSVLPAFVVLTLETIRLARKKGTISEARARGMARRVRSYAHSTIA